MDHPRQPEIPSGCEREMQIQSDDNEGGRNSHQRISNVVPPNTTAATSLCVSHARETIASAVTPRFHPGYRRPQCRRSLEFNFSGRDDEFSRQVETQEAAFNYPQSNRLTYPRLSWCPQIYDTSFFPVTYQQALYPRIQPVRLIDPVTIRAQSIPIYPFQYVRTYTDQVLFCSRQSMFIPERLPYYGNEFNLFPYSHVQPFHPSMETSTVQSNVATWYPGLRNTIAAINERTHNVPSITSPPPSVVETVSKSKSSENLPQPSENVVHEELSESRTSPTFGVETVSESMTRKDVKNLNRSSENLPQPSENVVHEGPSGTRCTGVRNITIVFNEQAPNIPGTSSTPFGVATVSKSINRNDFKKVNRPSEKFQQFPENIDEGSTTDDTGPAIFDAKPSKYSAESVKESDKSEPGDYNKKVSETKQVPGYSRRFSEEPIGGNMDLETAPCDNKVIADVSGRIEDGTPIQSNEEMKESPVGESILAGTEMNPHNTGERWRTSAIKHLDEDQDSTSSRVGLKRSKDGLVKAVEALVDHVCRLVSLPYDKLPYGSLDTESVKLNDGSEHEFPIAMGASTSRNQYRQELLLGASGAASCTREEESGYAIGEVAGASQYQYRPEPLTGASGAGSCTREEESGYAGGEVAGASQYRLEPLSGASDAGSCTQEEESEYPTGEVVSSPNQNPPRFPPCDASTGAMPKRSRPPKNSDERPDSSPL